MIEFSNQDLDFLLAQVRAGAVRDVSGAGNNIANPQYGEAGETFVRLTEPAYADGVEAPRTGPNPREISNTISNQDNDGDGVEEPMPNSFDTNTLLNVFGQYFDHDIDLIKEGEHETVAIPLPPGDPLQVAGATEIEIRRGAEADGTGTDPDNPRQHVNLISSHADQSQTYGSNSLVTEFLRARDADGNPTAYLLTGATGADGYANLPTLQDLIDNAARAGISINIDLSDPDNDVQNFMGTGQPLLAAINSRVPITEHLVSGDGRANENVVLTSLHTVFVREHNAQVAELKAATAARGETWTEEEYFQAAKIVVEAEYQRTVFHEFAPALAGDAELDAGAYDAGIDPSISAEFASAVYRLGHSMLNENIDYVDDTGAVQQISLIEAFLNPAKYQELGVEAVVAGSMQEAHQQIDTDVVNALRNQLFGQPLDLASINMARGREVGLPTLNEVRAQLYENGTLLAGTASAYGRAAQGNPDLAPYQSWEDFGANLKDPALLAQFMSVYDSVDDVDLWIGGLAETAEMGQLGSTFGWIFREQLDRLQHGDRFYYEQRLEGTDLLSEIESQTFADILMRTSGMTHLHADAFKVSERVEMTAGQRRLEGDDAHEVIVGNALGNTVYGRDGDDTVYGGRGRDTLHGNRGDDTLKGEQGRDTLKGGHGDDRLHGGRGADEIHGGAGDDRMFGDQGGDKMYGGRGDDVLSGGDGRDHLHGGRGGDRLDGGAGNDKLYGGRGGDVLEGGAGNDKMWGGEGCDVFAFGARDGGRDTIYDFNVCEDKLDLSALGIADSFEDLDLRQRGHKTVVTLDAEAGDKIVLHGVRAWSLTAENVLLTDEPDRNGPDGDTGHGWQVAWSGHDRDWDVQRPAWDVRDDDGMG